MFEITLPTEYNQSNYNTLLQEELNLKGNWKVALKEITFTHNNKIKISSDEKVELLYYKPGLPPQIHNEKLSYIKAKEYTIEELIEELNVCIKKHIWSDIRYTGKMKCKDTIRELGCPVMDILTLNLDDLPDYPPTWFYQAHFFNKNTNKWEFSTPPDYERVTTLPKIEYKDNIISLHSGVTHFRTKLFIRPSPLICNILDINYEDIELKASFEYAMYDNYFKTNKEPPEIEHTLYKSIYYDVNKHLFLMTDVIKDRIYGSVSKPVLKVIKFPSDSGIINIKYNNPEYCDLKNNDIKGINLEFKDSLNYTKINQFSEKYATMNNGFVMVTLIFKEFI